MYISPNYAVINMCPVRKPRENEAYKKSDKTSSNYNDDLEDPKISKF